MKAVRFLLHRAIAGVLLASLSWTGWGQYEVSSWRDHYPFGEAKQVMVAGDVVVGRTDFALFAIDTATYEMQRWVKGNPLSQSNPSSMAYDALRDQVVVGYDDGGLDVKTPAGVVGIPDLRIAQQPGSKRVQAIEVIDDVAYLCTAFGVVLLDLERLEILDTWSITPIDSPASVRSILRHDGQWLVGTDQGIFAAPVSSQSP